MNYSQRFYYSWGYWMGFGNRTEMSLPMIPSAWRGFMNGVINRELNKKGLLPKGVENGQAIES